MTLYTPGVYNQVVGTRMYTPGVYKVGVYKVALRLSRARYSRLFREYRRVR